MQDDHGGEAIAEAIIQVILRYGIQDNLGVFVSDNDVSNDVAVGLIVKQLKLGPVWFNRRGRCFGHVINLAAKAFLFGSDTGAFEAITVLEEDEGQVNSDALKQAQDEWRRQGPVGKVHNIVAYIKRSTGRREEFKRCQTGNKRVDGKLIEVEVVNLIKFTTRLYNLASLNGGISLVEALRFLTNFLLSCTY